MGVGVGGYRLAFMTWRWQFTSTVMPNGRALTEYFIVGATVYPLNNYPE